MLILIAESKTMVSRLTSVSPEQYAAHKPEFERQTYELMDSLKENTPGELAEICRISPKLATGMFDMVRDFPHKSTGAKAIEAYTGVVFRQLRPGEYDEASTGFMNRHLRIVSSLYGILRPGDIIKPYRLEYTSHIAPGGVTMIHYWRPTLTAALAEYLKQTGETEILDLMPADAAKCFDWKEISRSATVGRVSFITPDGNRMHTPHAGRLKELRGRLLDTIIRKRSVSLEEVSALVTDDFMPSDEPLTFIV